MSKYSEVNKEGDGKSDDIGNGDGLNHGIDFQSNPLF